VRRGDLVWITVFTAAGLALILPGPKALVLALTAEHRYLAGLVFFALMGALAEAIEERFRVRGYPCLKELAGLAVMWGLHGLAAALIFWLINGGVVMTQAAGLLPGGGYGRSPYPFIATLSSFFITGPFFTSLFLNLSFIPVLLTLQRLGRAALRLYLREGRRPELTLVSEEADWPAFIRSEMPSSFLFRTLFLTLVFMLPAGLWLPLASLGLVVFAALSGLSRRETEREPTKSWPNYLRLPKKNPRWRRPRFFFSPSVKNQSVISRPDCRQEKPLIRVRRSQKRRNGIGRRKNSSISRPASAL